MSLWNESIEFRILSTLVSAVLFGTHRLKAIDSAHSIDQMNAADSDERFKKKESRDGKVQKVQKGTNSKKSNYLILHLSENMIS